MAGTLSGDCVGRRRTFPRLAGGLVTAPPCFAPQDADIPFEGLCQLLRRLGFNARIRGSHHIFTKEGIEEILNLQPKGRHAKPYQVKQVRQVILKYRLRGQDNE